MADEYVLARVPDKTRLAELINQCKGADRTMNDFCAECGISPATMSRVINGKNVKAVDPDFLKSVWDHRTPDSSVEWDSIMRADGYVPNQVQQRMEREDRIHANFMERRNRANDMKHIITNALFERGVQTKKLSVYPHTADEREEARKTLFGDRRVMDLAVAIEQNDAEIQWEMEFVAEKLDSDDTRADAKFVARRTIQRYSFIFLEDAWEPEGLTDKKISFVFADPQIYDCFITWMHEVKTKLNSPFSAILVDMDKQDVVKECILSGPETESLFDKKVIEDNTDSDIDSLDDWDMK